MEFKNQIVFPLISGVETVFFIDNCSVREIKACSVLQNLSSTIAICCDLKNNSCSLYRVDKKVNGFTLFQNCSVAFLLNIDEIQNKDIELFPQVNAFLQNMVERYKLDTHLCEIKSENLISIFKELIETSLPPKLYKHYMLLKALELFLQLDNLDEHNSKLHFYPYDKEV